MNNSTDWREQLSAWVRRPSDSALPLPDRAIRFFEQAFSRSHHPERSWFGVHDSRASLVMGGLYLAALHRTGEDRGIWLLTHERIAKLPSSFSQRPVKSTLRHTPLMWAHASSFEHLGKLLEHSMLWDSYAKASELVIRSPIAKDRDAVQIQRGKHRLSEFWNRSSPASADSLHPESTPFQRSVRAALALDPNTRHKRLATAPTQPERISVTTTSFRRNPDVVAEVLSRAAGICEQCHRPAPFKRRDGTPYLEVHHRVQLADGGPDTVTNAVALCPNCHREQHYG